MMRKIAITVVFALGAIAGAQKRSAQLRHWLLTDNETLWIGRYSNCQYGYYSLLPAGVVAHAEHPPSPHHGFMINLPDVGVRTEVTFDNSDRFIWVNAEYNVTEESTLAGVSDYQIDLTSGRKENFKLVERRQAKLQTVPATRFKAEYDSPKGRVIEEEIVVLRSGVVYELGLRTLAPDYEADRERLEQTLRGFRFTQTPAGQCWNR
jgi:hypothetical protein